MGAPRVPPTPGPCGLRDRPIQGYLPAWEVVAGWWLATVLGALVVILLVEEDVLCARRRDAVYWPEADRTYDSDVCKSTNALNVVLIITATLSAAAVAWCSRPPFAAWKALELQKPVYPLTVVQRNPNWKREIAEWEKTVAEEKAAFEKTVGELVAVEKLKDLSAAEDLERAAKYRARKLTTSEDWVASLRHLSDWPAFTDGGTLWSSRAALLLCSIAAALLLIVYLATLIPLLSHDPNAPDVPTRTAGGVHDREIWPEDLRDEAFILYLFGIQMVHAVALALYAMSVQGFTMVAKGYFIDPSEQMNRRGWLYFYDPSPILRGAEPERVSFSLLNLGGFPYPVIINGPAEDFGAA